MRLSVTNAIQDVLEKRFHALLTAGAFPEVKFSSGNGFRSYSMFEYSDTYARFAKLVDHRMQSEMGEQLGIFTRKHSAEFLKGLSEMLETVNEIDVITFATRFRSFADGIRGT